MANITDDKQSVYTSKCGDCSAEGKTPIEAIRNAHELWWKIHKEEAMNPKVDRIEVNRKDLNICINLLSIEGKNTKAQVKNRLEKLLEAMNSAHNEWWVKNEAEVIKIAEETK